MKVIESTEEQQQLTTHAEDEQQHSEDVSAHNDDDAPSSNTLFTPEYVQAMNEVLAQQPLEAVLEWCHNSLGNLYQLTSFGSTGMVIIHALHKLGINLPTMFLDTLYHFEETLEHARQVEKEYGLTVHWYRCKIASTRAEFERIFRSTDMWVSEPRKYEQLTKVEPLERALNEHNVGAWISGRRRDQGAMRSDLQILEIDEVDGRVKVNPLAFWTKEEVWSYLRREGVPYNPLFDKSYTSIGDSVTTVRNEDPSKGERAGRFYQFTNKTECGIHNRKVRPVPDIDIPLSNPQT